MKAVYKIEKDEYYAKIAGVFVEDDKFVKQCRKLKFTETGIAGKYSEVEISIADDVKFVGADSVLVDAVKERLGVGYNPFDQIREMIRCEDVKINDRDEYVFPVQLEIESHQNV